MKLLTIILLFPVVCFSQNLNLNNNTVQIGATGNTHVNGTLQSDGYFLNEMPHCFLSVRDTTGSAQLALNQWIWTSFASLTDKESHGIERLTSDTLQYQGTLNCHLSIYVHVNGTTSNSNDDIWIRIVNTRSGFIAYGMALSGGANNYSNWIILGYDTNCQPLDKYVIQARNRTNGNDLITYSAEIQLRTYHFE